MAEQDRKEKHHVDDEQGKTSEERETREADERNEPPPSPPSPHSVLNKYEKFYIIFMAALAGFFSPISSQIYFPALPILAQYYDKTTTLINLTVTTYMIVQGIAPAFVGNFADISGRRPAYILAFIIYTAANIGLAVHDSYGALLGLRCLQSAGSSATSSIGYAVAADIASPAERGKYIGPMTAGSMAALSLGPVIGGLLVRYLGWRSIFWFLVIISGAFLVVYTITVRETAREIVGNGSIVPSNWWRLSVFQCLSPTRRHRAKMQGPPQTQRSNFSYINPLKSFVVFADKAGLINLCHIGITYLSCIAVMTNTANMFGDLYNLDSLKIGLCFLPFGITGCIGAFAAGKMVDINYCRIARKHNLPLHPQSNRGSDIFPFEKARLQIAIPVVIITGLTLIPYGWVLQQRVHLAAPLVLQGILGFCVTATINVLMTLLIDLFPKTPASASAAANLVRCWLGAVTAAVIEYMITGMGLSWCFAFFGLVTLASLPFLGIEYVCGMKWRKSKQERERN